MGGDGPDGPRDSCGSMGLTGDGGVIVGGQSRASWAPSQFDKFDFKLCKLSASGSMEWEKIFSGSYDDRGYCVAQTYEGGYVFAGRTSSNSGVFTGNHSSYIGSSVGYNEDIALIKTDSSGNIQWTKCYGGSDEEVPYSIMQTADNGFIMAGSTRSSNTGDVVSSNGVWDGWLVKLSAEALATDSFEDPNWVLFPNPATNTITIESLKAIRAYSICDTSGRIVKQGTTGGNVDVSDLSIGIYTFKGSTSDQQTICRKFIKQ